MTIKAVAECAGVGQKTVHNIFGTKDDLLVKAATFQLDNVQIGQDVIELAPGIPRILAFTESTMEQFRKMPEFMATIIQIVFQSVDDVEKSEIRIRHMREITCAALESAMQDGELRPDTNLQTLSDLITGNQWGTVFLWLKKILSLEQFIKQTMINHCVTLLPFCIGERKQWLEARLKQLIEEPEYTSVFKPNQELSVSDST